MKLRAKILLVIASLMGILYLLVAGALIPELATSRLRERRALGRAMSNHLAAVLESLPHERRREAMRSRPDLFHVEPPTPLWVVLDGEGRIAGWSRSDPPPERLVEEDEKSLDIVLPLSPDEAGARWKLYAATPFTDIAVGRELWSVFVSMFLGTVVLGVAVYGLVLRLVITPVERLATASRASTNSRGILPLVPHSERADEIGELIRSYNTMVREVNDLRVNLEQRVASAVSELELAQKKLLLSERLSVTGRLAAGVAHEINNPLGGMLNAARTLAKNAAPGTRDAEYLELIEEGLGRVQVIVSTMLRFARPSAHQSAVDLKDVIEGALLFCKHRLAPAQVELRREYPPPGAPQAMVAGQHAELGQVFLNLIVNALDAMEQKPQSSAEDRTRVLTLCLRRDGSNVCAGIKDSGIGMPPSVRARAGNMFFSTKAEGHGTGMGLAMVTHIVQAHGGTVEIESQTGAGTTVTLSFPAEQEAAPAPQRGT